MFWHTKNEKDAAKSIILCADDYAQSESISRGILALAKEKRLNAMSCLVNLPYWSEAYPELETFKPTHFIGLHLNFSFGQALSALWQKHYGREFQGLLPLLRISYSQGLKPEVVAAEIRAQIDMFSQDLGVFPDFIDGHQHIQQLPIFREALIKSYLQHYPPLLEQDLLASQTALDHSTCFLRSTAHQWRDLMSWRAFPKSQALMLLGGRRWWRMLHEAGIPTNSSFAGIYSFPMAKHYRAYFKYFLSRISHKGLIMCHPGGADSLTDDPLNAYRHYEWSYLMSDEFIQDMQYNRVFLSPKPE